MEEDPDDIGKADGVRRNSLVERAAKKIVIDRGRSLPKNMGQAADASPDIGHSLADTALLGGGDAPETSAHDEHGGIALVEQRPDGTHRNGGEKRESKLVNLDLAKLASRNILTPQSKRNRTVEEFRLIKRRVLSRRWAHGDAFGNTVMVTSALPEEGKTTISVNLAMSIAAEEDVRVLLVDADFIKPDALRQLGISVDKGLIDVIQDPRMDISDVMLRTNIERLSLIPSGKLHDRCTELLASARMSEIVAELARRYDDRILIFDSPPVLATTESVTLASHMGQIVFVVQAERTRRQLVDAALELLGNREHVGLVLNRATHRIGSAEFGHYYNTYYSQHGGEEKARSGEVG